MPYSQGEQYVTKIHRRKIHNTSYFVIALTLVVCAAIFLSPVFSASTNSCGSCHGGYYQYLDILEGNNGNNLPTTLTVGQTSTVTVVVENRVNTNRYTALNSVSLTLKSQNGHFTVTTPTYTIGTLQKGTAVATWQITGVSAGSDSFIITATGRNSHQSLSFSDSYQPSPLINIQSPAPPPPPPPPPTTYTVTIQLSPNGTTIPASGIYNYQAGTSVTFTATPNINYKFDYWIVNGISTATNPMTTQITSYLSITPVFTLQPPSTPPPAPPSMYNVTILSSSNGTTTPAPGTYNHTAGSSLTFAATPNSNYKFDYWLIDGVVNTTNPLSITLNSNLAIDPVFTLQSQLPPPARTTYAVTMQSSPNGTTSPSPGTYNHAAGASLSIAATPNGGYKFDYWLVNGVVNATNPLSMTLVSNVEIAPVFTLQSPPTPITYTVTVQPSPNGTTMPIAGVYPHPSGISITLTANPNPGYKFDFWLVDGVANATNPISMTIIANFEITPIFTFEAEPTLQKSFTVTLLSPTNGQTSPPPGLYSVKAGATINLTALPDNNYRFDCWSIDGEKNSINPLTLDVTHDATVVPEFTADIGSFESVPPPNDDEEEIFHQEAREFPFFIAAPKILLLISVITYFREKKRENSPVAPTNSRISGNTKGKLQTK